MASTNSPIRLLQPCRIRPIAVHRLRNQREGKDNGKGDKDVTIQSPVANMHIGKDVKGSDTGISIYPGAKLVEKDADHGSEPRATSVSPHVLWPKTGRRQIHL